MKTLLIMLLAGAVAAGCESKGVDTFEKVSSADCLKATVLATSNMDCGYPALSFAEDSVAIQAVTGQQGLIYIAKFLPANLNIQGKKLCLTVEQLQPEDDFACTMMGITYPHIKIVSAKERE